MIGFILAAGFGTRLRPLTEHLPKALVPVGGTPLLQRSLEYLSGQGFTRIGVNSHYLHDQMVQFQRRSALPFELFYEERIRGTGGAFDRARSFLLSEEFFFVINVDIVTRIALAPFIERFTATDWVGALLTVPNSGGAGTIVYEKELGRYLDLASERHRYTGATDGDFIGAALYRREFLDLITADDFAVTPVWKRAGERGRTVGILELGSEYWRDIGTTRSLAAVHFDILDGTMPLSVPGHLLVDHEARRCYHRNLPSSALERAGEYSWLETESLPRGCSTSRCVVFDGASIAGRREISDVVVTKWGDMAI